MNKIMAGRYSQMFLQLNKWIFDRKKFLFIAPEYVVVGLSRKDYDRHFPAKKVKQREYTVIYDEAADIGDEQWEILRERLEKKLETEG